MGLEQCTSTVLPCERNVSVPDASMFGSSEWICAGFQVCAKCSSTRMSDGADHFCDERRNCDQIVLQGRQLGNIH